MAGKGDVTLTLAADPAGLTAGLQQASAASAQTAQQIQQSMGHAATFGKAAAEGAHAGATALTKFTDVLRDYRKEEVQQARATRFFAQDLASLLPIGNDAAGVFGRIAAVVATSAGPLLIVGLAFEAVKVALEAWTESSKKAEEKLERQKQLARDIATDVGEAALAWEEFAQAQDKDNKTALQAKVEEQRLAFLKEQAPVLAKLQEAEEKLAFLRSQVLKYSSVQMYGLSGTGGWLGEAQEEVDKAQADLAKIRAKYAQSVQSAETVGAAAQNGIRLRGDEEYLRGRAVLVAKYSSEEVRIRAEAEQKKAELDRQVAQGKRTQPSVDDEKAIIDRNTNEEIRRAREAHALELRQFLRQQELVGAAERVRIEGEALNQIEGLELKLAQARRSNDGEAVARLRQEIAAVRTATAEKLRLYDMEADAKLRADREASAEEDRKRADDRAKSMRERAYRAEAGGNTEAGIRAGAEIARLEEEYRQRINLEEGHLDEQLRLQQEFQQKKQLIVRAALTKTNADWTSATQTMGSAMGNVFAGMVSGSTNAVQAVAQMAQQVIQIVTQMAIKSILAKAADASAGAAASQSAIPVVGPVLAVAAMGAMFSAVAAMAGRVSAEGGYDIPAGVNPVAQLHQREMVLPAKHADAIRRMADGGGGSAAPMNITIKAWDSRDVARWARSSEGQRFFGAGLTERARNGRTS